MHILVLVSVSSGALMSNHPGQHAVAGGGGHAIRAVPAGFQPRIPGGGPGIVGQSRGAKVLFVDDSAAPGGDGSNWPLAYRDLQQALAEANNDPAIVEIRVAEGTYRPDAGTGDRNAQFLLLGQTGLALLGGFPDGGGALPERDPAIHETILSGDLNGDDVVHFEMLEFDEGYQPLNPASAGVAFENISDNAFTVVGASGADETVLLDGFAITGGHDPKRGGGLIANYAGLALRQMTFRANSAGELGGAIFISDAISTIYIEDCTFEHNTAIKGGGLYLQRGGASVTGSIMRENAAATGGALCFDVGSADPIHVADCELVRNLATQVGGAIWKNSSSPITLDHLEFSLNAAGTDGGGAWVGGVATLTASNFFENAAGNIGGAARFYDDSTISDCTFDHNVARTFAGALSIHEDNVVTNCRFTVNVSHGQGGGIFVSDSNQIRQCDFIGNVAHTDGGGVAGQSRTEFADCLFSANRAYNNGGGANLQSNGTIDRCVFVANQAGASGGGLHLNRSNVVSNCTVRENSAGSFGGGARADGYNRLDACAFLLNQSQAGGGGIWLKDQSTLTNDLFIGNSTAGVGGALGASGGGNTLVNITAVANDANEFGGLYGGLTLSLRDSILWDNWDASSGVERAQLGGNLHAVSYTIVMGLSDYYGNHNSSASPRFVDPLGPDQQPGTADENLSPDTASPAIDSGSVAGTLDNFGPYDFAGRPRFVGFGGNGTHTVDRGAYEAQDCDADGLIDSESIATGAADDCNTDGIPDACQAGSLLTSSSIWLRSNDNGPRLETGGSPMAMDADVVCIGASSANTNGTAYLFDAASGTQFATLTHPDPMLGDRFGFSVAVDGPLVAVGAPTDNAPGADTGSVHLFNAHTGQFLATILPNDPGTLDEFGHAVAMRDGLLIVGSWRDFANSTNSGSAYVFSTATGTQLVKLLPADGVSNQWFGVAVAIDAGVVAVGASGDDDIDYQSGSAYLFSASTGAQLHKLLPDDGVQSDRFGSTIAIGGGIVAVGSAGADVAGSNSGAVYLFDVLSGNQLMKIVPADAVSNDDFGGQVAIQGGLLAISATGDDDNGTNSGMVYLYELPSGTFLSKLMPPDTRSDAYFGRAIALGGGRLAVGAAGYDDAGVYTGSASVFTPGVPDADFNGIPDGCICPADLNADGVLDFFDLQAFLIGFAAQASPGDYNADGLFDFFDVQAYLNAYSSGCP